MTEFIIMSYNIMHMNKLFEDNVIKPGEEQRTLKISEVIQEVNPHILGILEGANSPEEHQHFIDNYLPNSGYKLASGASRGSQNLVVYYRQPFEVFSIDEDLSFYEPWNADIDKDGLKEHYKWHRKPLEVVFKSGLSGPRLRIILVHAKSKGIFDIVDFHDFQKISLANRKRLVGQAIKLRDRLDKLNKSSSNIPIIVMGDMNDGPGFDPFKMMLGRSFVETVMGSINEPSGIFHNALWWMTKDSRLKKELYTAEFPDPIVESHFGRQHKVWIDHILLSQDMLQPTNTVRYVMESGKVSSKNRNSRIASDHFAVYCKIKID